MKARSVARELALITLFQLDRSGKLSTEEITNDIDLKTLMLEGVRALSDQTSETLKEAAKDLNLVYDYIVEQEQEHPVNLESPLDKGSVPVPLPNTRELAERIKTLLVCADNLAESLRIPELVALANQSSVQYYAVTVLKAVQNNLEDIDKLIEDSTEDWTVSRLARMDRSILRLAVGEMKYVDDVDYSTSIDEAVELAKHFAGDDSYKFINGVLGAVVKKLPAKTSDTITEADLLANTKTMFQ